MKSRIYRLHFELSRIRKLPINIMARKAVLKFTGFVLGAALVPVTAIFHFLGYRHVNIFTDRIGHLALEPDCLLKEQELGQVPRRKWIMLAPPDRIANEHMLTYWEPHFIVIRSGLVCYLISSMTRFGLMRHDISHYIRRIGKAQDAYRIYTDWNERPPLLKLSTDDKQWGELMLRKLGLPDDAWFVCVHSREGGYSPVDEILHHYRNCSIQNTFLAMQEIANKGGWVVRVGDPSMQKLPRMKNVIDYAHHSFKSDRLDIILSANAKFFLGNTSGVMLLSTVFGVSCALSNMIPITAVGFGIKDISIPKMIWSIENKRYLRFDEILNSNIANYQYASLYEEALLHIEENSKEDIHDLICEMLDRLDNIFVESQVSKTRIRAFNFMLNKKHYCFGKQVTLGSLFLTKHKELWFNQ